MMSRPQVQPPPDADKRRAAKPVIVYALDRLPAYDAAFYDNARADMSKTGETIVPPREGRAFDVPAGHFFRIVSIEGPQVGDLNLWNAADLSERFFSGKTRALHATHVSVGDRLWSSLPYLRPMATIIRDRIAAAIKEGKTLAETKAMHPTLDYDGNYGSTSGPWTTDMFIEEIYKELSARAAAPAGKVSSPAPAQKPAAR